MRVRVLAQDLKLLGSDGRYIFPKVHDIVDIHDTGANAEIKVGNVEPAEDAKLTRRILAQMPSRSAHLPEGIRPPRVGMEKSGMVDIEDTEKKIDRPARKVIIGGKTKKIA